MEQPFVPDSVLPVAFCRHSTNCSKTTNSVANPSWKDLNDLVLSIKRDGKSLTKHKRLTICLNFLWYVEEHHLFSFLLSKSLIAVYSDIPSDCERIFGLASFDP